MTKRQDVLEKRQQVAHQCAHFRAVLAASLGALPTQHAHSQQMVHPSPFVLGTPAAQGPQHVGVSPTAPFLPSPAFPSPFLGVSPQQGA
eukprot:9424864-Alexandrium_andersonii.AAC.1